MNKYYGHHFSFQTLEFLIQANMMFQLSKKSNRSLESHIDVFSASDVIVECGYFIDHSSNNNVPTLW